MSAWNDGPFDNDTALDLLADLEEVPTDAVPEVLRQIFKASRDLYLDAEDGQQIVAAASLVTFVTGEQPLHEPARPFLESHPFQVTEDLKAAASQALRRVLAEDSELLELFEENDGLTGFKEQVESLQRALQGH